MDLNDKRNQSGGQIPRGTHEPTVILGTTGDVTRVFERAMPRTGFYVKADDTIVYNVTSQINNININCRYRLMRPDGTITINLQVMQYTGGGAGQTLTVNLIEGWLLSVQMDTQNNNVPDGACYVLAAIGHGNTATGTGNTVLFADYLISFQWIGWPGSGINRDTQGRGWPETLVQATTGVGTQITLQLASGHRFAIDSVAVTLVTSATVANRLVVAELSDQTRVYVQAPTNQAQAASTTFTYYWGKGLQYGFLNGNTVYSPWVFDQESGGDIGVQVIAAAFALQAGDQFSNLIVRLRHWHEND